MLTELYIQDIVLIDRLCLSLGSGLTALTGETGAGKSIMLDSLGLATGGRANPSLVRHGAKQGIVAATFEPPETHEVWDLLAQNGLADEDAHEIILRRVQGTDGRAKAYVNDHPVSVAMQKSIAQSLIEVHGQHQGHGFLQTSAHMALLDDFGGLQKQLDRVTGAWTDWQQAKAELSTREAEREQAAREADYLRHVVDELGKLAPQADEETSLAVRRTTLMAAEKITADLSDALSILSDDTTENRLSSALGRMEKAVARLEAEEQAKLQAVTDRIDAALNELQEARSAANMAVRDFEFDPIELNEVEERLFALRAAARKYNTQPDRLNEYLLRAKASLELAEEDEASVSALQEKVADAEKAYAVAAAKLSAARQRAAKKLDKAVAAELAPLKLGKAHFSVSVEMDASFAGANGSDKVQFMIATNPGAPLGPLKQIASGGELSRFVLALKAALMARENRTVIIFDEVDAGIGGAVADAVGERLAKLASAAQVMVVTHSPQVAARASVHYQVSKSGNKSVTSTVVELDEEARVEEIARMLSGAEVTKEARAAAAKLLTPSSAKPKRKTSRKKAHA
jgi:DNA repair protein RecN (Recombination protein N)